MTNHLSERSRDRRVRRVISVGLAAATLGGLAACSSDGDSSSVTEPPSTEVTAATDAPATAEMWTGTAPNMTPVDEATAAEWQASFEDALASADGLPGAWIAVSDPELGYWSAAIGDAVVGTQPATVDDHSRIGSITKTFTGTAVLEQVDKGTINLDDTVAELVPDLAEQFPPIAELTVEQLLAMESGIGDYANVVGGATAVAIGDPSKVWTPEELIASGIDTTPVQPVGTPGYSTTNYIILGRILEAVTGETIDTIDTGVAESLGLTQTALLPPDDNSMPDPHTNGYIEPAGVTSLEDIGVETTAGTDTTDWSISWGGAGGGMYSVIDELFQWTASGMGTTLLSKELGDQRLTFDTEITDAGINYGLGIFELPQTPGWIGHSGQAVGWEAWGLYNPETGATFALMINATASSTNMLLPIDQIFTLGIFS